MWTRYCFRRAAFRALSTPTAPFLKPRSITTVTPSALRITRQIPNLAFQRRWSSDEVRQDQEAETNSAEEDSSTGVYDGSSLFSENGSGSPSSGDSGKASFKVSNNRRQRDFAVEPNETIYIGNLFFDVTSEDLKSEMERFGTVESSKIIHDNRGLSRGWVCMKIFYIYIYISQPQSYLVSIVALYWLAFLDQFCVCYLRLRRLGIKSRRCYEYASFWRTETGSSVRRLQV